jgi:hypothetical protein
VQVDEIAAGGGAARSGVDFTANETWNRLNADPLLLIKKSDVGKVKAATSNPYLVAQIKEQLRAARAAKDGSKKAKKEKKDKKSKKEKHSRKHVCVAVDCIVDCCRRPKPGMTCSLCNWCISTAMARQSHQLGNATGKQAPQ